MPFRTVVISSHSKLEYSLGYLVFKTADEIKRINISEIQVLIIETTMCSITSSLINELIKNKIDVIFCDVKHDPLCQLIPFNQSYNLYKKLKFQLEWKKETKDVVWAEIVKEKIRSEIRFLSERGFIDEALLLKSYYSKVEPGDSTSKEGHAAKVYFNKIFYPGFVRQSEDTLNVYLNYGYSLILSLFNRNLVSLGYLTQLGIHHISETNPFNLSCDLMEPFRVFVDRIAITIEKNENYKDKLLKLFEIEVNIAGKKQNFINAIQIYTQSVLTALNESDLSKLLFPEKYEF